MKNRTGSGDIGERQLRGQFTNLERVLATNLETKRGLPEILEALKHRIQQLDHVGTPLPKTWVEVRKDLETRTEPYISQQAFLDLCGKHGFKRQGRQTSPQRIPARPRCDSSFSG